MNILKSIIFWILSIGGIIILTIGVFILLSVLQSKLFLPEEYVMWIFKSPFSNLIFIYEIYIIFGFAYIFNKHLRWFIKNILEAKNVFFKRYKIALLSIFITLNILMIYTILFNVTVITNSKIINYTFLSPQGKEYSYKDIVKIETGIYGKKQSFPYMRSKGEFYYIIHLNDGTKIDLAEDGGTKNADDPRFIIEKLDMQYVNMGIYKQWSLDNFVFCTKHLDKIYTDKIRQIIENTK